MAVNTTELQQAIAAATALGITDRQLYDLAKTALADALKTGCPTTSLSLPTGVSFTVSVNQLLLSLPDLRRAAQVEAGTGMAFGKVYLP
jgi:hypothetical protein